MSTCWRMTNGGITQQNKNSAVTNCCFSDDVARSVILLINTIYFNGYWSKPFAENDTTVREFSVSSKASISVPFMTKTDDFFYSESSELEAKLLRLPYKVWALRNLSACNLFKFVIFFHSFIRDTSSQCILFFQTNVMD